jgi:hypothetical protein
MADSNYPRLFFNKGFIMGQKQVKKYRKTAEKATNMQAFSIAQAQLIEIMQQPFFFRLMFCKSIMFPPRHARIKSGNEIIAAAHGISAKNESIKQAEGNYAG